MLQSGGGGGVHSFKPRPPGDVRTHPLLTLGLRLSSHWVLHWGLGAPDRSRSLRGGPLHPPCQSAGRERSVGALTLRDKARAAPKRWPLDSGGTGEGSESEEQEGTPQKPGSRGHGSLPRLPGTEKQAGLSRAWRKALS